MEPINFKNVGRAIFAGVAALLTGLALSYMTGCSHVEPYTGAATRPVIREVPFPPAGNAGLKATVVKSVAIDNPFERPIHVVVDCYFVHELDIPPRATRYVLAETTADKMYQPTCKLVRWYRK